MVGRLVSILGWPIFRGYVSFRECSWYRRLSYPGEKGSISTKPIWGSPLSAVICWQKFGALGMRPGVLLQFLKRPTLPTGAPGNGSIAPWLAIWLGSNIAGWLAILGPWNGVRNILLNMQEHGEKVPVFSAEGMIFTGLTAQKCQKKVKKNTMNDPNWNIFGCSQTNNYCFPIAWSMKIHGGSHYHVPLPSLGLPLLPPLKKAKGAKYVLWCLLFGCTRSRRWTSRGGWMVIHSATSRGGVFFGNGGVFCEKKGIPE